MQPEATLLKRPRVEHLRVRREVLHVAGDHGEAVALGGGHEQAVHHRRGLTGQFGVCGDLCPDVKGGGIERQDAPGKALLHLAQPGGKFLAAARVGFAQFEDAFFNLSQRDDADEQAGLVLLVQPGDHFSRGGFLGVFGKRAGVEQPAHGSTPAMPSVRGELVEP
jgi:hypothetical protein